MSDEERSRAIRRAYRYNLVGFALSLVAVALAAWAKLDGLAV